MTLLWCPDQPNPPLSVSYRNSTLLISLISSLDTLSSLRDILSTRVPPLTMPETVATPPAIDAEPAPKSAAESAKPVLKSVLKSAPKPVPKSAAKQAANKAHKRQISEAIPRNKRADNERADAGKAHLEKEDHTDTGNEGAGTECRRSGRVRKPKQRN